MEKEETIQCCFIFQSPPVKRLRLAPAPKTTWAAAPPLKIAHPLPWSSYTKPVLRAAPRLPWCVWRCQGTTARLRSSFWKQLKQ